MAIESVLAEIDKRFGKGTLAFLSSEPQKIESISTSSIGLDNAIGIGGIPKGRIIEIYGESSSGKTTTCLHIVAEAQKQGGLAAFVDVEHALDPSYAKKLGVNLERLLLSQPDCGEDALEIVEALVRSGEVSIVVVDSVAALLTRAEINGEMGDAVMGSQARLMGQAMRKLTPVISKSNCAVIFINQLRQKIGVVFGSPDTTTGGKALAFYSSVRAEVKKLNQLKQGEEVVGSRTKVKVVKNKVAPPFKECEFDIMYGEGISKEGELVDLGVEFGIIEKSGSWYKYNGEQLAQGRENAKLALKAEPELFDELKEKVLKKLAEQFDK